MSAHARRHSRIRECRGARVAASYKPRHRRTSLTEVFRSVRRSLGGAA